MPVHANVIGMKQQTAFAVACGITAFLLVGAGAVVTNWRNSAAPESITASAPTTAETSNAAAQERAVFLAREAVYQQRLAEANRRLSTASATITTEPTAAAVAAQPQPQRPPMRIDASHAGQIALAAGTANGAAAIQRSELVLFRGVEAHEIILDNGVVYIDAASGAVLFSTWSTPPAPPPPAGELVAAAPAPVADAPPPISESEQEEEHETEGDEHEDGDDVHEDEQAEHEEDHSEEHDD
jgi:cytoskeletal protein RodZ